MRHLLVLLVFVWAIGVPPVYSQHRKSGLAKASKKRRDPFSSKPRRNKIHFDAGLSFSHKKMKAASRRKKHSLSAAQRNNRNHSIGRRKSKGIAYKASVSKDAFRQKHKRGFRSHGKRGESFYKKKRKFSRLMPHGGREARRMDKANKSFKKK